MPKVKLGKHTREEQFAGNLKAAANDSLTEWKTIAKQTGRCPKTMNNYLAGPDGIPLGWLKMFVKITNMNPDYILNYLYEGKYRVERK